MKLPVIVYNMNEVNDVLASAIKLRDQLQYRAEIEEKQSGKYIRPIVLLQAQPRTDEDNETFDRIKARLIGMGVPETQIRIKTAEKDEIHYHRECLEGGLGLPVRLHSGIDGQQDLTCGCGADTGPNTSPSPHDAAQRPDAEYVVCVHLLG